jgi:hypothetical protein
MRSLTKDITVTLCSVAAISVASVLLYRDFRETSDRSTQKKIGTIIFKKNSAQRKFSDEVLWSDIEQQADVYNYDSIRTEDNSISVITLHDGSKIELRENTLVTLALSETAANVSFSRGSISAEGSSKLSIAAGKNTISVAGANVNMELKQDRLDLNVNSGRALVNNREVGENQMAVIGETTDISEKEFILQTPPPGRHIIALEPAIQPLFSWKSREKRRYVIEIARDSAFREMVLRRESLEPSLVARLVPGAYYWRAGYAAGERRYSETRSFSIFAENRETAVAPSEGSSFFYTSEKPPVQLRWSGSAITSAYSLSIATDRAMKNIVKTMEVRDRGITIDDLEAGVYYWKIKNLYQLADIDTPVESTVRSFSIIRQAAVEAPQLLNPQEGVRVSVISIINSTLPFSWSNNNEFRKYEFQLSADSGMKNPLVSEKVGGTYYSLKRDIAPGRYYWRVQGMDSRENRHPSAIRTLNISPADELVPLSPANGEALSPDTVRDGIRFSWKDPNSGGSYLLEAAADSGMKTGIRSWRTNRTSLLVKDLSMADFHWRVSLLNAQGKVIAASGTSRAYRAGNLPKPQTASPANGAVVDMSAVNLLAFSWGKVSGATHYRFTLHHLSGGGVRVLERQTKDTGISIRQMEILDEGNFFWEIQAMRYEGDRLMSRSETVRSYFRIILKQGNTAPEIISPSSIYIR